MKKYLFALLLSSFLATPTVAQYYPVDTLRLNKAYNAIINGPNTLEKQTEFFRAFPSTWLEYTLTYLYSPDKSFDNRMSQLTTQHCTIFGDSLYLINDTTYCNKYINLVIGLNDTGENCITLQENLHGAMIKYGDTMMHLISKLRKGHQMQFWMFYWSSTDETAWREEVVNLKNKYNKQYPQEIKIMQLAFEFFENGIDYPQLLPHLEN